MVRSWLKTAWRYSRNSKLYTLLNLAGLTTGAAVAILIGCWVRDEWAFDSVHSNIDHIAEIMVNQRADGGIATSDGLPMPLAAELRHHFGNDFSRVALYFPNFRHILTAGDKSVAQTGSWVQPDLPVMLTLPMLQGSRDVLKDPSSTLIARSLAAALFGTTDPMGRTIRVDNGIDVKVGGVFEDLPANSTFNEVKIYLSWDKAVEEMAWMKDYPADWDARGWKIFVQLDDHADPARVDQHIKGLLATHGKATGDSLSLHPMSRWHLFSEFSNGVSTGGRIRLVRLFTAIGVFVLLLACINFMNLATARSERRAKEVGVRKVIGSLRRQLVGQFLGEALLMTTPAVILAVVAVQFTLPVFNRLAGKTLRLPWADPFFAIELLGFILLTALLAGSYPAFYLSRFRPVRVLKGDLHAGPRGSVARKVLVVLQFSISISLIIGTILVDKQVRFAKSRPVGYSRAGLLTIGKNTRELFGSRCEALRDDLLRSGTVSDMAQSSAPSTEEPVAGNVLTWPGEDPNAKPSFAWFGITADYGHTIGWRVTAGRDFDRSMATDSDKIILNESAVSLIGFQHPIGKEVRIWGQPRMIIGVVSDMVTGSPYQRVLPGVYQWSPAEQANDIILRVQPSIPMRTALTAIEKIFRTYNPASPFDYRFVDADYAQKFVDEEHVAGMARAFTLLAIAISCLGLFGLSAYSAEQRTREIGIRKVLGSSGFRIWQLLTGDILRLVALAVAVAIPLSYLFMHKWLSGYSYRIAIGWDVFLLSGGMTLLIAIATVSYHAVRAAHANPVKALRSQ
jgi:putative ABC transport system permease protein